LRQCRPPFDGEIAPLYSEQGRPAVPTRFMIGLLLLKHIYALLWEPRLYGAQTLR